MENLIDIIEKFLAHSDEKLDELAEKNRSLKKEESDED